MRLNPHQQICKYWAKWNEHPAITSGVHSIWEEEDSGTNREPHGESASGRRWERDGTSLAQCCQCLGPCWVVIILQVPPATAMLTQPAKETSEIIPWLLLYRFESCWRQLCLLGYILNPCPNCSCTHVTPRSSTHNLTNFYLAFALPPFSCVHLIQRPWICLFFYSAAVQ